MTKVAGIEARGFVLATAAALELGVGFIGVRKAGSVLAGKKVEAKNSPGSARRRGRAQAAASRHRSG